MKIETKDIYSTLKYKKLKENRNFLHINGYTFKGSHLCYPPIAGQKITYIESTNYCRGFLESLWKTNFFILNSLRDHQISVR